MMNRKPIRAAAAVLVVAGLGVWAQQTTVVALTPAELARVLPARERVQRAQAALSAAWAEQKKAWTAFSAERDRVMKDRGLANSRGWMCTTNGGTGGPTGGSGECLQDTHWNLDDSGRYLVKVGQ